MVKSAGVLALHSARMSVVDLTIDLARFSRWCLASTMFDDFIRQNKTKKHTQKRHRLCHGLTPPVLYSIENMQWFIFCALFWPLFWFDVTMINWLCIYQCDSACSNLSGQGEYAKLFDAYRNLIRWIHMWILYCLMQTILDIRAKFSLIALRKWSRIKVLPWWHRSYWLLT
jgi:hypothetical protein